MPIERFAPGDLVWARDLERVETVVRAVRHALVEEVLDFGQLFVTAEHPIWPTAPSGRGVVRS